MDNPLGYPQAPHKCLLLLAFHSPSKSLGSLDSLIRMRILEIN